MCSNLKIKEFLQGHAFTYVCIMLLLLMSLSSCTIKENREVCPCILTLHLDERLSDWENLVLFLNGENFFHSDTLDLERMVGRDYRLEVPRGKLSMLAVAPSGRTLSARGRIEITPGEDCPPVYTDRRNIEIHSENHRDTLLLHKNHCRLSISFTYEDPVGFQEMDMELRGNVSGYDEKGLPFPGEFRYRLEPDGKGTCEVLVPRQLDPSLELVMGREGKNLQTFAVGEFMQEVGYDWANLDLKDCRMTVDVAITALIVEISGWKKIYPLKFVI